MSLPTANRTGNFRAANSGTMYGTAGNPPTGQTPAEGAVVNQWVDSDGLSTFYSAGATPAPVMRSTTGINNGAGVKSALGFNGTSDFMRLTGLGANYATDVAASTVLDVTGFSFFVAVSFAANPSAGARVLSELNSKIALRQNTDGTLFVRVTDGSAVVRDSVSVTPPSFVVAKAIVVGVVFDGTNTSMYVNSLDPSFTSDLGVPGALTGTITIGGDVSGTNRPSCRIGQVVFYNKPLSGEDLNDAMMYLMDEWSYQINTNTTQPKRKIYMLPSITGLKKWVDYIPVQKQTGMEARDVGTYNDDGCLYVDALTSITGLKAWVDYTPCYLSTDPAAGRWRTDDTGWIPVSDI